MTLLGRLARQSGVYALGNAAVKAAGLALAPLMLNPAYLTIEGFGYFALLMVTAQLGIYVAGLGLSMGLVRHLSGEEGGVDRESLPFTALVMSAGAAAVAFAAFSIAAPAVASVLVDDAGATGVVRWLAAYVAFKVVAAVPMTVLRVHERAGIHVSATVAELVTLVGLAWYLMGERGMGLEGLVTAYAGSAGIAAIMLSVALLTKSRWRFDRHALRPLLDYGVPLVLASLAGWFLNAGDRYLLKWLADPQAVAGYDWAARLAGLINMLFVQSFQLAFTVIGMKALAAGEDRFYPRVMRHYVVWTGAAVLGLSLFTDDGMRLLVTGFGVDAFYGVATDLVFPLALGFMGFGLYVIVNNVLLASGHTRIVGATVLWAAVLNALLNLVLIPIWGALGAALATVVAYGVLAALAARAAGRAAAMTYRWSTVAGVVLLLAVLVWAGRAVTDFGTVPRLAARAALMAVYAGVAWRAGWVQAADFRHLADRIASRVRDDAPSG